jgi:hypothetical protein
MIQRDPHLAKQERSTQAISSIMVMMLLVLLIQLWLITIALEAHYSANESVALPTFLGSGFCFLLNLWLLKYVVAVDRDRERD